MLKKIGLKEFVASVDAVMAQQEKEHPPLRHLHARLSPEYKEICAKIERLLTLQSEEAIETLREEIVAAGETATRALLDILVAEEPGSSATKASKF